MKTIKIHRILTKDSGTKFIMRGFAHRLTDSVDSRDDTEINQSILNFDTEWETKIKPTIEAFRKLTTDYRGYVGYDRTWIDNDTLDTYTLFNIEDNESALEFSKQYLNEVYNRHIYYPTEDNNQTNVNIPANPITAEYIKYRPMGYNQFTLKIEDSDGTITNIV